jgi:predicted DNA-binding protein with PD1-like motif
MSWIRFYHRFEFFNQHIARDGRDDMQYSQGTIGRVFVLRLESEDRLPESIETFAREHDIQHAMVTYLGGAGEGSRLVVGPEKNRGEDIVPIIHSLQGIQEVVAVGTLFPNASGDPVLHMHAAVGREGDATVGCTRAGVQVWLVGEVVLLEFLGVKGERRKDAQSGLELLRLHEHA